jgi:hypothetical protein
VKKRTSCSLLTNFSNPNHYFKRRLGEQFASRSFRNWLVKSVILAWSNSVLPCVVAEMSW